MATRTMPTMALLRSYTSTTRSTTLPWTARTCLAQAQPTRSFSSTEQRQKKGGGKQKRDPRITNIRYFLHHPLTPRPLRFSRTRFLRHWTIHRAWQRYQDKLRQTRQLELERQYNSMAEACEQLRLIDGEGLTLEQRAQLGQKPLHAGGKVTDEDVVRSREGRLYRMAMLKNGIWNGVPIEYARIQTETPARDGWNHGWTR
ncbi:Putative ribosomal protein L28/L40 [Septoria linicola]|uniref:Large ribosomal subunit protein mL40 n=1 Tax=Septoria linicola TaxID=215465 RepID=A0A9Q9AST7_9PEZI|nr:putative ribosomal protein L28/L40 [Septoria linicola]USW55162.1 Putative ribosomal protein L28/L40 [Septoria linicola]